MKNLTNLTKKQNWFDAGSARSKLMAVAAVFFLLLTSLPSIAQNTLRVKGRITSGTGEPVSRASVAVKGSSVGVTADDNGNFEIQAPANSTLVISAVNYTTLEISVSNREIVDVTPASLEKTES